ncbi:hypothetical protein [Algoriphagus sp. A40]|uniref:hypothetical protein n=1 Tax=Algoriphagus sp. A40 TaxID=1945863 RepID=UPI0009865912|nr:hypothetical protein [Algoriphagus sp. A40]
MHISSNISDRLRSSLRFSSDTFEKGNERSELTGDKHANEKDLEKLLGKGSIGDGEAGLSSLIASAFLISHLPVSELEFDRIISQGYLPDSLRPIGTMYKVAFGNIRQFLHPKSKRTSIRELRGRYLTASVFMEVATSFLVEKLEIPKVNRVFWGLGGSLILVPPHFGPRLKSSLAHFNRVYGIPEIGFELTLADTGSNPPGKGKNLLVPNEDPALVPRDKLFGWQDFKGESGENMAEFVTQFAVGLAKSEQWCIKKSTYQGNSKNLDIASRFADLPYWLYPAGENPSEMTFSRNSYLSELGDECPFMDVPLEILASSDLRGPITYFRLDISGMRESLAIENEHGIKELYQKCRQMDFFFRETIPSICRSFNQNAETGLEVALLHSTCDDVVLVTLGKNPERLIARLREACKASVDQNLVFGGVELKPEHAASDLAHAAMLQLVASKKQGK